jgi:hypothetical protein
VNISEANAANVVLRALIAHHTGVPLIRHTPEEVVEAAALLGDKAYKAISAGLDGDIVRQVLGEGGINALLAQDEVEAK